jgi:hypothetical protein
LDAIIDVTIFFHFTIALLKQFLKSTTPIEAFEPGKQFFGVPNLVVWAGLLDGFNFSHRIINKVF